MRELAEKIFRLALEKKIKIAVAESCTGGQLSAALTSIPGASGFFERGFITYSNESKIESLGVPVSLLERHGAVSEETALAMAEGALTRSHAHIAASVTGIAGPDGGSKDKPVGLVYIGIAAKGAAAYATKNNYSGARAEIQAQAVETALAQLIAAIEK